MKTQKIILNLTKTSRKQTDEVSGGMLKMLTGSSKPLPKRTPSLSILTFQMNGNKVYKIGSGGNYVYEIIVKGEKGSYRFSEEIEKKILKSMKDLSLFTSSHPLEPYYRFSHDTPWKDHKRENNGEMEITEDIQIDDLIVFGEFVGTKGNMFMRYDAQWGIYTGDIEGQSLFITFVHERTALVCYTKAELYKKWESFYGTPPRMAKFPW